MRLIRAFSSTAKQTLVYEGPLAKPVRTMKGVSVTSAALTLIGMPMVVFAESSVPAVGQLAMCGTVTLFGLGTTTMFHLLFRPYISKMWRALGDDGNTRTVTVETFSLLAQKKQTIVSLDDIQPAGKTMHPMISFRAKEQPFFIHPECIKDKHLLRALTAPHHQPSAA